MVSPRSLAPAVVTVVAVGALGLAALGVFDDEPREFAAIVSPLRVDAVVAEAHDVVSVEPRIVETLADGAEAAVAGYALAAGVEDATGWTIDLSSLGDAAGAAADRAAHGLLARAMRFERSGPDWAVLSGEGSLPGVRPDDDPALVLAAVVEVAGNPGGALIAEDAPEPAHELDTWNQVVDLAWSLGLQTGTDAFGVYLSRRDDLRFVAELPYVCHEHVPLSAGAPCSWDPPALDDVAVDSLDAWTAGITGSLVPGAPQAPASADGGVGWTNLEAQRYVADGVTVTPDGMALTATPRSDASVDELPFTSGLVVLDETLGLGTVEVDVVLPAGDGLWPAVWLLDTEACDMPGRCPAYATDAYHEIDLLETNGARPELAVTSLHWWSEQLRSASASTEVAGLSDGSVHTIRLERRPGLLRWLLDGEEVYVIAGPVDAGAGPHRVAPMRLILNLAVGGRFAGDLQIGRQGRWWGDAWVPASFPDVGWDTATFEVRGVRVG